jgi:hypothetical protein
LLISLHTVAAAFGTVAPVTTMRARVAGRDRQLFVGRAPELAYFDDVLAGRNDDRVVHVIGPGGIGKSALLREVARRAAERRFETIWVDGRDVPPFPTAIAEALAPIEHDAPAIVVFDSYELIGSLDSYLRDVVIPDLPDTTVVVFGSRQAPSRGWFEQGWDSVVHTIEVSPLSDEVSAELLHMHGVEPEADVAELVRRSHGSPLALVVGAETGPTGSMAELADRLIADEVDPEHHRVLTVAALARVTTPELLGDVLGEAEPQESYKWLAGRSFSEPLATGVALHALVADAVRARVRQVDPIGEAALRRSVADHLYRRAVTGQHGMSTELQHLVVDPNVRWGFASDVGNRYRIDTIRPGDAEAIGMILTAVGAADWWGVTEVFFREHPEHCGVARDADGRIGGYYIAASPTWAPAAAEHDPLLGPWLRYARQELNTTSAVIWREAVDLTGEMGEVTSLLGAGGLLATGVANPRYGFLPISPLIPAARLFSEALGAEHVPALDVASHGMHLECHVVDFGPHGLLGFQRDWIYRESGAAAPPVDVPDVDAARLLRYLREPGELALGPSWLGDSPAERLANLRRRVTDALAVFSQRADDQMARAIVQAAYLDDDAAAHETVARRMHLSRSAYFRRLQAASVRVGEEVIATARRGR